MTTKKLLIDPLKEMLDRWVAINNGFRPGGSEFRLQIIRDMGGYQSERSCIDEDTIGKMMEESA